MTEPRLSLAPAPVITYEEEGPREGPCECGVRICGDPGDIECPVCTVRDVYEPCEVQGFACGWMGGGCEDGCCTPEQVAIVERIHQENAAETRKRWPNHGLGLRSVADLN